MDITPTADDKGLQRLKLERQDKSIKPAAPVEGYPRIPDSEDQQPNPPPPHGERRRGERRDGKERRQHDDHAAYDTRGKEDRRHQLRRTEDRQRASSDEGALRHIDEKV